MFNSRQANWIYNIENQHILNSSWEIHVFPILYFTYIQMDGRTDRQTDRWTERQTDRRTGRSRARQLDTQTYKNLNSQTERYTDKRVDRIIKWHCCQKVYITSFCMQNQPCGCNSVNVYKATHMYRDLDSDTK